jgi:hypothetical protein
MSKYYIAARYSMYDECNDLADLIEKQIPHSEVVSTWHQQARSLRIERGLGPDVLTENPEVGLPYAERDIADLRKADVLIMLDGESGHGGKYVEFGWALERGLRLVVLGRRWNVFQCLPRVEFYPWYGPWAVAELDRTDLEPLESV